MKLYIGKFSAIWLQNHHKEQTILRPFCTESRHTVNPPPPNLGSTYGHLCKIVSEDSFSAECLVTNNRYTRKCILIINM